MSELCPKCRQLRNTKTTVTSRKVKDPEGKTNEIRTTSYHCETCGTFIRSQDEEVSAEDEWKRAGP